MKRYLILGLALQSFALPSKRLAEQLYQKQNYKKALQTWEELSEESPENLGFALRVSELKFLLEGRGPALQFLQDFQKKNKKTLSPQEIQDLQKKAQDFSKTFLLEEAQTHYLQALSKTKLKEWPASYSAISQALALEPQNMRILELKVEIEKQQGAYAAAQESLKQLLLLDSESLVLREKLAESYIFHRQFQEAKQVLEDLQKRSPLSNRAKLAWAVSLWELGKQNEAKKIIDELNRNQKIAQGNLEAPLLWMLHRIERAKSENPQKSKEEKALLSSFKKVSLDENLLLVDGWDPYRLTTYLAELSK